jgi:hypothetical protein
LKQTEKEVMQLNKSKCTSVEWIEMGINNLLGMLGSSNIRLGLLGEKFYFTERLRYRSIFYIVPAVIFVISHTTHAVIYHQRSFN